MCHVTVTLRSCDFFGRVVINPQEVMMALSPRRETNTHTYAHREGGEERQASRCHASTIGPLMLYSNV